MDSDSSVSEDLEPSLILTPAMQEVIRVREVRKSMEQSGHFFTPICSPMSDSIGYPSSTPRNDILENLTLDASSEEEPTRKISQGSSRSLRSRKTPEMDSTSSCIDSSTTADASLISEGVQRRVIHKRKSILLLIHVVFIMLVLMTLT